MERTVISSGIKITYELTVKKVKNINLRIKNDGKVYVSANKKVPNQVIDEFVIKNAEFILKAIKKYEDKSQKPQIQYFKEDELKEFIIDFCKKIYPYYEKYGIEYPAIKFRKMVSRWGSCNKTAGIITFNTYLMFAPKECVVYVIWHEFTHLLQPNHSQKFYDELFKVCPQWKVFRKMLREINIKQ